MLEALGYSIRDISSKFEYLANQIYHLLTIARYLPIIISAAHLRKNNKLHRAQTFIVSTLYFYYSTSVANEPNDQ
jgi:hypothetical protein